MKRLKIPKKSMSFWVALILSIVAGISVFVALNQLYRPVKVIVPTKNIPVGSVIQQNDLAYKTISRRDMHPDSVTQPQSVIGKYAKDNLYASEPILGSKLLKEKKEVDLPAPGNIAVDETYITFKKNEAKWPDGLKDGNMVTIVGNGDTGPSVLIEKAKVMASTDQKGVAQIDTLKTAVGANVESITLVLKWEQLGPLLHGKQLSKELWIVPEHPDTEVGKFIFPQITQKDVVEELN